MVGLDLDVWTNIFRNLNELEEEDYYDGTVSWVEVIYLDPMTDEDSKWGLCHGEELFEEGFQSEDEAQERLEFLENELL